MYFIGFCYMCDVWRKNTVCPNNKKSLIPNSCHPDTVGNARGAIAFSFFSMFAFAILAVQDFQRVKYGDEDNQSFSNPYAQQTDAAYVGDKGGSGYQGGGGADTDVAVM